ncbi:MAG TPA: hypothetical protein VNH18_16375 [Bryobacteraceae bacterium]|nr:hypothetical protein [Bryobacteraceae bacterium]
MNEVRPASAVPLVARFLPSLTDIAFLMPLIFLFVKLDGARTLLGDGDTGWHVRAGEWMLANGRVPVTDMFSFSRPGAPWFAWEWLWDIGFAILHRRWGMSAVVAASALVICLSSMLLFRLIRRQCENGLVAIAVTLLATGGCAIHWLARPHLFTLLFLIVTLHITFRAAEGRLKLLWWLVPLTLLWTNLHGGFFVVFLILACYIGQGLLNAVIERTPARRAEYLAGVKPWALVFACSFAVTFVNPYGWQLHKHVIEYLTDPYQLQHITEFQSMNFHSPVVVYFEPLMMLSIVAAVWDLSRRRFAEAFLSLGWLHLALIAQRNLPLFAIAASPSVARALVALIEEARHSNLAAWLTSIAGKFQKSSADVEETDRIGRVHLISGLAISAVAAVLLLTPPAEGVLKSKVTSTYDPGIYPEKALSLLKSPETHNIFAEDEWGDYLIYKLYPLRKVFVDGRSDFYGDDFGERYLDLMNVKWGWQNTLDKYSIDTIVISPKFSLTSTLKISPDWRLVYDDKISLVFRRAARPPVSLASSQGEPTVIFGSRRPTVIPESPNQPTE